MHSIESFSALSRGKLKKIDMATTQNYRYVANQQAGESTAAIAVEMLHDRARILELGAGPGAVTQLLKRSLGCHVTAVELDASSIEELRRHCDHVISANLNEENWSESLSHEARFDAVLAADVLEHLQNPARVLSAMAALISPQGCIVLSLPHVGHSVIHACLLNEDFEYRDWGLLDRTHIRFFGLKNMQQLVETAGLKIVDARFVVRRPEDTEYASTWARLPEVVRAALQINPYGNVYQCVIKAVPKDADGEPLHLMALEVDAKPVGMMILVRRMMKKILPEKVYMWIRGATIRFLHR